MKVVKLFIKNNRILSFAITPLYWYLSKKIYSIRRYKKNPSMPIGELNVFSKIYSQIKVIVDIGARYDVDYLLISQGNNIKYFLFEANPKFFRKLNDNLKYFSEDVTVENLAVSNKSGFCDYFEDSQSIVKNTSKGYEPKKPSAKVRMSRLDDYFLEKNLTQIDFLKSDIEMHDYFALLGLGKLLDEILFIQIELGIDAEFENSFVANTHYYELLEPIFHLYICKDENNSLWSHFGLDEDLVELSPRAKDFIAYAQKNGEGFNIFGVNRNRKSDLSELKIGNM